MSTLGLHLLGHNHSLMLYPTLALLGRQSLNMATTLTTLFVARKKVGQILIIWRYPAIPLVYYGDTIRTINLKRKTL